MFLVPANTVIQVQAPKSLHHFNWGGWIPYTTPADRLYEKEDVWDPVALHYRIDVPQWIARNVLEHNRVVIHCKGKYALVAPKDIRYLD